MAIGIADYGATYWLGVLFGKVPAPDGYWVALLIGDPAAGYDGDLLTTVEVQAPEYGRLWVPAASWSEVESGMIYNGVELDFGTPTVSWGIVSGYALCSHETSGEIYAFGEFGNAWEVGVGQGLAVTEGAIQVLMRPVDEEIF